MVPFNKGDSRKLLKKVEETSAAKRIHYKIGTLGKY